MAKGFYCLFCDKAFTDVVDAQAEAIAHTEKCGQEMTDTIARLTRERDEAWAFLRRTAMTGGSIVSSAAMTAQQIAIAGAADRMIVTPDGYWFIYVPGPRWEES